jgi:dolichol-phosphate mannosyltransferase
MDKTLIFVPTYNERENAPRMVQQLNELGLDADVLFVDDNSPDGTGRILEDLKTTFTRLSVHHRPGKLGIGSAHLEAIRWAYERNYSHLITLDCDFTHSPSDIPKMLERCKENDIVVGSRWAQKGSLSGWNVFRRGMTGLGHFLTMYVLGIPQDASGAFRVYCLERIPSEVFSLIKSKGYAFFFESLYIFVRNRFKIGELPIVLPARTYGHSKMLVKDAIKSACQIFNLYFKNLKRPEEFLVERNAVQMDSKLIDPQDWDSYWNRDQGTRGTIYEIIAGIYRRSVIRRCLEAAIKKHFPPASEILHAGCGSGQVDIGIQDFMELSAIDISNHALRRYSKNNPNAVRILHGSIFKLPFDDNSFDGVYNLGVMEHFTSDEIRTILTEFHRVTKPGGKIVLFWPHSKATSVLVLGLWHRFSQWFSSRSEPLHPPEVSLLLGKEQALEYLRQSGFDLIDYSFGPSDFFVQAVVVGCKREGL